VQKSAQPANHQHDRRSKEPPGTKENPLNTEAVNAKARDLMQPVLGAAKTERLIERINGLETVKDIRELRLLFTT
jgi:hypothetical protein